MPKSSERDRAEGALDRVGGAIEVLIGKVTGSRKHKAKGGMARLRGRGRSTKGRGKRRVRRAAR
jgi:uncharacterized protein YjbJ (UPF0337 family)